MKIVIKFFILFVPVVLLSVSCSEKLEPKPYEYTKLFTGENSKTWKLKLIEITQNGSVVDRFTSPCLTDDSYIFYANPERAFQSANGNRKCDPETAVVDDSWSFNNATASLTITLPFLADFSLPYIVREVDKDDLKLEIFLDEDNTESYRLHFEATDEE